MIKDQIEFFNVEEIGPEGQLWRFPKKLMDRLGDENHDRGRFYSERAIGVELRFRFDGTYFDIRFSSAKEPTEITLFFGDYQHRRLLVPADTETTFHIELPEKYFQLTDGAFSKEVIRFVIGYSGYVSFKGIETFGHTVSLPRRTDLPSQTLLIYGSSISHGSECAQYIHSYPFLLSQFGKVNVLNKAIPGGCQAEYIMSDYLKTLSYDLAFVEFGVNVLGLYDAFRYRSHFEYLLKQFREKPLFYTGVLKNGNEQTDGVLHQRITEFQRIAEQLEFPNYIPPEELLDDFTFLTTDLVHPSDFGQLQIAIRLAKKLGYFH